MKETRRPDPRRRRDRPLSPRWGKGRAGLPPAHPQDSHGPRTATTTLPEASEGSELSEVSGCRRREPRSPQAEPRRHSPRRRPPSPRAPGAEAGTRMRRQRRRGGKPCRAVRLPEGPVLWPLHSFGSQRHRRKQKRKRRERVVPRSERSAARGEAEGASTTPRAWPSLSVPHRPGPAGGKGLPSGSPHRPYL